LSSDEGPIHGRTHDVFLRDLDLPRGLEREIVIVFGGLRRRVVRGRAWEWGRIPTVSTDFVGPVQEESHVREFPKGIGSKLRPMVGAVIYIRVSTKEQTENLSLSTQLKACEEYCERQGLEVLARFREEGESAKTADRTELQKLLQYCRLHKGKVQFVVVFNLTRFAREKYDHFALRAHLKSLGISLRSATEPIDDTSTGKLMEGVLAAFALASCAS
jgi:hypothetical protein